MTQPDDAGTAGSPGADAGVAVTVVRTGGFAGLRRTWTAAPPADDADRWAALIQGCPWEAVYAPDAGADRFQWRIRARCGDDDRSVDVPDGSLTGPWRELVTQVQSFAQAAQDAAEAPDAGSG